jgi:hypothetical protein
MHVHPHAPIIRAFSGALTTCKFHVRTSLSPDMPDPMHVQTHRNAAPVHPAMCIRTRKARYTVVIKLSNSI